MIIRLRTGKKQKTMVKDVMVSC